MKNTFKVTDDILASSGQRISNLLIDRFIFYGLFALFGIVVVLFAKFSGSERIIEFISGLENINNVEDFIITNLTFTLLYFTLESTTQRTVGKYASKTMVVTENGEKPSAHAIAILSICRAIPFDSISYLGKNAYGWHDSLSKTYVVDVAKFKAKKALITDFEQLGKSEDEINF